MLVVTGLVESLLILVCGGHLKWTVIQKDDFTGEQRKRRAILACSFLPLPFLILAGTWLARQPRRGSPVVKYIFMYEDVSLNIKVLAYK